jgi:hypothetical protein
MHRRPTQNQTERLIQNRMTTKTIKSAKTIKTPKSRATAASTPVASIHSGSSAARGSHDDPEYDQFLARINARFQTLVANKTPLFTTDEENLFPAYLAALPPADRQHHSCHACRHFVERFGGLVVIDEGGRTTPAIWNEEDAPAYYRPAVAELARLVRKARVNGVFHCSQPTWGQPTTGEWRHFAVTPPPASIFKHPLLSAGQAMAEKREDYKNMQRALEEFKRPTVEQALTLLETESLYRSEKTIGPVKWLFDLHVARDVVRPPLRNNVLWRAVALAPAGFCHPRASMAGTLLEDIAAGLPFADVSRKFAAKMHPLQYQRPQAAPTAGNLAQAEKIVAQLGAAGSLARRFARLEEVEALWTPRTPEPVRPSGGVFGHLTPKGALPPAAPMTVPPVVMTWEKFSRTVLPDAESIDLYVAAGSNSYAALVTAVNAEAPPILQWDREDRRNPVSWYLYVGGSTPDRWNLKAGQFCPVTAVTLKPSMWNGGEEESAHQGKGVALLLEGARDTQPCGAAIFPETLKAEFRAIRATIEAYSMSAKLEGREEASACGLMLHKGAPWNAQLRVVSGGRSVEYQLDRWD